MSYITTNNAFSTLAGGIVALDTSLTVAVGNGDRFPVIVAPDFTYITLENAAGNIEIVKVIGRAAASDTFSIIRAQDNTTAKAWATGDVVELRVIALLLNSAIAHPNVANSAHQASAIAYTPGGSIAATNVQAAIAELETEIYGVTGGLAISINANTTSINNHISNTSAHIANNIVNTPAGNIVSTTVQNAINELSAKSNQTQYALTTGTADFYEASPVLPITAYNDNQILKIKFHVPCNAGSVLRVSLINPPLNLKMYASDGTLNVIGLNDFPINYIALCLVANGGTDLIVPSVTETTNITPLIANSTLTWPSTLGRNFITTVNALNVLIPLLSTVPVGESFTLRSEVALTTIAIQGSDLMNYLGADIATLTLGLNEELVFVSYANRWKLFKNNTTPVIRSWQNVTANRLNNTIYTNTLPYEIVLQVFIQNTYPTAGFIQFTIDGLAQTGINLASPNSGFGTNIVPFILQVPPGKTYKANMTGYTAFWEFR